MIVRIVKLSINPDQVETFLGYFGQVKKDIRTFRGCKHLELLSNIDQQGVLFTYSLWEKQQDLDEYLKSELFKNTWSKVKPLFIAKAEAWSLNKIQEVDL